MWVVVVMGGRARSLSRLCDFSMALLFLKEKVLFSGGSEVSAHEVCVAGEEVLRRLRKQTLTHSQRKGEYKQEDGLPSGLIIAYLTDERWIEGEDVFVSPLVFIFFLHF